MISNFKKIHTLLILSAGAFVVTPSGAAEIFVRWKTVSSDSAPASRSSEVLKQATYARLGLTPLWSSSLVKGLDRVEVKDSQVEASIQALEQLSAVQYAQPNFKMHRFLPPLPESRMSPRDENDVGGEDSPNDPLYRQQWALNANAGVNLLAAWKITTGSKDIKVAVIDTGVDATHEELAGRVVEGFDFIDETPVVTDHHGHGTHVSGIIGAKSNNAKGIVGINQEVTIIPIRAVPSDGDETDADVIQSFEFAVQSGARVANCSFGKAQESQAVADTILAAGERGLLVVAAAGNDGQDINVTPGYPASFHTPNMVVVASSTSSGGLSFFSNFGLGLVDLAAPGSSIYSSIPGNQYAAWSGTSMAAPQVTGIAALALAANPTLSVSALKDILLQSITLVPGFEKKVTTGGRIDAEKAVKLAHAALAGAQ